MTEINPPVLQPMATAPRGPQPILVLMDLPGKPEASQWATAEWVPRLAAWKLSIASPTCYGQDRHLKGWIPMPRPAAAEPFRSSVAQNTVDLTARQMVEWFTARFEVIAKQSNTHVDFKNIVKQKARLYADVGKAWLKANKGPGQ